MTITDRKYNYITKLETDLSNNSFLYNNRIFTCDISDTLLQNITEPNYYLTNKAAFLMDPNLINCVNKFNNIKPIYKYQKPLSVPITGTSSIYPIETQQRIQKQNRVESSTLTSVLSSLTIGNELINNNKSWNNSSDRVYDYNTALLNPKLKNVGIDVKHNSYDRYLGKKKSQYLKSQSVNKASIPIIGNKTQYYGLINSNNCNTC